MSNSLLKPTLLSNSRNQQANSYQTNVASPLLSSSSSLGSLPPLPLSKTSTRSLLNNIPTFFQQSMEQWLQQELEPLELELLELELELKAITKDDAKDKNDKNNI